MNAKYFDPTPWANYIRRRLAAAALRRAVAGYDLAASQTTERSKFNRAGLDPVAGRERLDNVLREMSCKPFDHLTGTDSVHWLLFACLSLTDWGGGVRDILEIGTFRGKTTLLLSRLFPQAEVVTVDLPDDDPILHTSYGREDPAVLSDHHMRRVANLAGANARFVAANSIFVPEMAPGPYDLIWLDGGHIYPEIAWDICNAFALCRPGGIIMCDDVFTHPHGGDGVYGNGDAHQVIEYVASRARVEPRYFLKRENPEWSALPRMRKFVVVLEKPVV